MHIQTFIQYSTAYFIMLLKKSFIVYIVSTFTCISGIFIIIYVIYCCITIIYISILLSRAIITLCVKFFTGFTSIDTVSH